MPRTEAESKTEVTAADTAFHQAILSANLDQITALTDPTFIWTHGSVQTTRQQLLDDLRARKVKYEKPDPAKVSISVYGDTAIVRGANYTLTFINQLGVWRAVALHKLKAAPVTQAFRHSVCVFVPFWWLVFRLSRRRRLCRRCIHLRAALFELRSQRVDFRIRIRYSSFQTRPACLREFQLRLNSGSLTLELPSCVRRGLLQVEYCHNPR